MDYQDSMAKVFQASVETLKESAHNLLSDLDNMLGLGPEDVRQEDIDRVNALHVALEKLSEDYGETWTLEDEYLTEKQFGC